MTRSQSIFVVTIVALIFASLASWGVWKFMVGESQKAKSLQGEKLVVAAADIPVGTKLDISQVKTISMPRESYPKGGIGDPAAVTGRVVIKQLSTGDQITEQKLMPREGAAAVTGVMSYLVPKGHRAVTVGVNEVAGVAGFLAPNNRVDVVLTTPIPNDPKGETITKIVLQNVPVLATGQVTEQKDGKPVVVPTVTLDLTPDDSEKLVHAAHKGPLQLLLRNVIDTAQAEGKGATILKVLSGLERPEPVVARVVAKKAVPAAVKAQKAVVSAPQPSDAPRRHSVEIIKGKERTTNEFAE
jgi:pilus assembly protein CpaB